MKSSTVFALLAFSALPSWSQAPSAAPSQTPSLSSPSTSPDLKVRGPEAVAQKDPNRVVATINGKQVTAKQAADLLKLVPDQQRRTAPNLETLLERVYLVNDLADQAAKDGLDQQSPWKEQLKLDRDNILAQAYMSKLSNASSQPLQDPKQYYDAHQDQFDIAKLSGIVIGFNPPGTPASNNGVNRTEQEAHDKADEVSKKIKAGADIATLARTESDNQASAAKGGDLGTLAAGSPNVPADLKNVVFNKLQAGQVSEPIRSANAYYIIKLDSRTKQTFDQARPEILQKLQADRNQTLVKQELDKYKVQVSDPDFFATGNTSGSHIPSLASPSRPGSPSPAPSPNAVKPPASQ
jgi:PPIC-type PPIASE domain